ncbi:Uncharacterised protein [Mycobacteroides abscessus subsp. abscessus]|nr:Uncharacterised protein [Mycobacteroides abscessus subsp. abscessus]
MSSISLAVYARSPAPSSAKPASDVAEIGVAALISSITLNAIFSRRAGSSSLNSRIDSRSENGSPNRTRASPR